MKLYIFEGKKLTLKELVKVCKGKEAAFMGCDKRCTYHLVTSFWDNGDVRGVYQITKKEFTKIKLKDYTTASTKERLKSNTFSRLVKALPFNRLVEFNIWCKRNADIVKNDTNYSKRITFLRGL